MLAPIQDDVAAYEAWLRTHCDVVEADLARKHEKMAAGPHDFLRATFFRWAATVEEVLPELADAPRALCAGDMHVENFGAWRDAEGRLAWGVNDFDEAERMPAAFDLVRLMTSARLSGVLDIRPREAAAALIEGYCEGLAEPRPILLSESHLWLRRAVISGPKERRAFWKELEDEESVPAPAYAKTAFATVLPKGAVVRRYVKRRKGSGSLGRPRYAAIAEWAGGRVAREAKALVPSAWSWAHRAPDAPSHALQAAAGKHRCPDPFLSEYERWLVRRIAPDSRKIELGDKAIARLDARLLAAMGAELASVHCATPRAAKAIARDLAKRDPGWLHRAAKTAAAFVTNDHAAWVEARGKKRKS